LEGVRLSPLIREWVLLPVLGAGTSTVSETRYLYTSRAKGKKKREEEKQKRASKKQHHHVMNLFVTTKFTRMPPENNIGIHSDFSLANGDNSPTVTN